MDPFVWLYASILPQSWYLTLLDYGCWGAIILIVSVMLHELAHVFYSLKYGLEVRQIILFVFGGIADIKEETKDYKKEFKIAVAGPIASFSFSTNISLFMVSDTYSRRQWSNTLWFYDK